MKEQSRVETPYLLSGLNVYGLTVVHPCRVKSFREAESTVMDNLNRMLANKIIHNLHLILIINLTRKLDYFHNKM